MVLEIITSLAYGNFILAGLIIVLSVIGAKLVMFVIGHLVLHVTSKTKNTLDDVIVGAIKKPLYVAMILIGIYFAIDALDYADMYLSTIRSGFSVIWILLGAYTATRVVKVFFTWYASQNAPKTITKLDSSVVPIIRKILAIFIYAIAFIIILKNFGIEITPLLAGLGIGGLAIALALQDTLSNLFSGMFLISDKVIKAGEFIETDSGVKGTVEEVGWRSTRIITPSNNCVIIPNSKLANSTVTDYSAPTKEISVTVQVGVGYGSDLDKAERVTKETAKDVLQKIPGGKKDFEPSVRYHAFGESNINFSVTLRVENFSDQYLIIHEFIKALKKRFDQEGIEISYPVRKVISEK